MRSLYLLTFFLLLLFVDVLGWECDVVFVRTNNYLPVTRIQLNHPIGEEHIDQWANESWGVDAYQSEASHSSLHWANTKAAKSKQTIIFGQQKGLWGRRGQQHQQSRQPSRARGEASKYKYKPNGILLILTACSTNVRFSIKYLNPVFAVPEFPIKFQRALMQTGFFCLSLPVSFPNFCSFL